MREGPPVFTAVAWNACCLCTERAKPFYWLCFKIKHGEAEEMYPTSSFSTNWKGKVGNRAKFLVMRISLLVFFRFTCQRSGAGWWWLLSRRETFCSEQYLSPDIEIVSPSWRMYRRHSAFTAWCIWYARLCTFLLNFWTVWPERGWRPTVIK